MMILNRFMDFKYLKISNGFFFLKKKKKIITINTLINKKNPPETFLKKITLQFSVIFFSN